MSQPRLRRRQWKRLQRMGEQSLADANGDETLAIEFATERVEQKAGIFIEALMIRLAIEFIVWVIKNRYFTDEAETEIQKLAYIDFSNDTSDQETWDDE